MNLKILQNKFLLGFVYIWFIASLILIVLCCGKYWLKGQKVKGLVEGKEDNKKAYMMGYGLGRQTEAVFKTPEERKVFTYGLKAGVKGKDPIVSIELNNQKPKTSRPKGSEKASSAMQDGKTFLEQNAKKSGVKTSSSGLQYKVLKEGTGKSPSATDTVSVHYKGTLIDGTEFDSSYKRGQSATFPLNQVIKGWTEGLQLMKEGAKYEFYIPSELGYGSAGAGPKIPPHSVLIFEVELLKVQ